MSKGLRRSDVLQGLFMFKNEPLSYDNFPYWVDVVNDQRLTESVDQSQRDVVIVTSRQVGKTSLAGMLCSSFVVQHDKFVMVITMPTDVQISRFSVDVLKGIWEDSIITSEIYYDPKMNQKQVKNKSLANRSRVILANIYMSALSARGIPADGVWLDEYQDTPPHNAEIVISATKRSPYKYIVRSGTPLEPENDISLKFDNSTQNEWAVACTHCGNWNVPLGLKNVGKNGLICSKCHRRINPRNGMWVEGYPGKYRAGYHINELAVPPDSPGATSWNKLLIDLSGDKQIVHNEILGLPFSCEKRPITTQLIASLCDNSRSYVYKAEEASAYDLTYTFAGLDWAMETSSKPGDKVIKSFTMLTVVAMYGEKLHVLFRKKYYDDTGDYDNPDYVVEDIIYWLEVFRVRIVGMDYGIGNKENKRIMATIGSHRCMAFQYLGDLVDKTTYVYATNKFLLGRTKAMDETVEALQNGVFEFANYEDTSVYLDDLTGIYKVFNHNMRTSRYGKSKADDWFQNLVYVYHAYLYAIGKMDYVTKEI